MSVPGFRRNVTVSHAAWLLLCALTPVSYASLIWDNNIGNALPIGSFSPSGQDGLQSVPLANGFAFPFLGTTYNSISVATSGFIWLVDAIPPNGAQCCVLGSQSTATSLFQQGIARISTGWSALRPDLAGTVNFNEINDANGARTDITYNQVATDPGDLNKRVSFQLQLFASGKIVFSYMGFDWSSLGPNPATLLGLTAGFGASVQSVDLLSTPSGATLPFNLFDYLPVTGTPGCTSGPNCLSLTNDSFIFTPAATGWQFVNASTPEPSMLLPIGGVLLFAVIRIRQIRITKC